MYYIDYSLNTNYMIRNLLKAANALTFSTMFLHRLRGGTEPITFHVSHE